MFLKHFRRPKPITDAEYLAVYRSTGDLVILGELYERHMDLVYAVCYNYLRDQEEAKDAVMQLFEQLVTDLQRHDVQHFKTWLHTVARNYCLMQLRSRANQPVRIDAASAEYSDDDKLPTSLNSLELDDDSELEEDLSKMEACLQTLPTEQRTCLTLFYLERKSYAEVAELTGYDMKQVKSYLQNGRRNLKLCMRK
ncbi:sigma-70 family RNA polymerase sigma factor [Fibrisoma montanum]|uniref:Sigma-70 family RNA polymerase sigma factor n=1 Tax=Fibrisoma montanum TaxID=2305895 RepID=A0A418MIH1_9BACT|nr:sigma-70 family RNA polymerase sigma factor [Fibrisoma montanum]RIV27248.1 sigma-70 family RNA polymerase sigma factor [Fibrisoma montanum]